jgi:hypothetical protein
MKTRTRPFSPGRYEQHFADARSDPYALDAKLAEPAACSRCGASYHDGHWQWQPAAAGAKAVLCPACRRIEDGIPAGYLTIDDVPAGDRRDELLRLIEHHEARARNEHPLERVIAIEQTPERVVVTTTDIHLARGLATAVKAALGGSMRLRYSKGEKLLRAHRTA